MKAQTGMTELRGQARRAAAVLLISVVALGFGVRQAQAAEKRPSPPMGWNSYTGYSIAVTEEELLKNIDFLSEKLLKYGYDTVTVDNGWFLSGQGEGVTIALDKYGRPESHPHFFPRGLKFTIDYAYKKANMVRITSDIWDNRHSLSTAFQRWEARQTYTGPELGSFLDMEMICFGRLYVVNKDGGWECKFTPDQKRTFMVQRALAASPLMLGGVLYGMDEFSMSLFTNADILRCDQNGVIGRLVHRDGKLDVWKTPGRGNENNGWIGVFNRDGSKKMNVELSAKNLGLNSERNYRLKNLWTSETLSPAGNHAFDIPADGIVLLSYQQEGPAAPQPERGRVVQPVLDQALRKSGRSIVFSVCEWGDRQPWLWAGPAGGNWGIGHTTNVRGRVHDRIPFKASFRFDMELFHWQPKRKIDYATTTHWYAFEGGTDNGQTTPDRVREAVAQPWTGPDDVPASTVHGPSKAEGKPAESGVGATIDRAIAEHRTGQFIAAQYASAKGGTLPFQVFIPNSSANETRYPLLVFLHGAGELGDDNVRQLRGFPKAFVSPENQKKHPCYAIAPQCLKSDAWSSFPEYPANARSSRQPTAATRAVIELIEKLIAECPIDKARIYVTGLSLGGEGRFDIVSRRARPDSLAVQATPMTAYRAWTAINQMVVIDMMRIQTQRPKL